MVAEEVGAIKARKRQRTTVVCINCRRRKTKCNREEPCSTCIKLKNTDTCKYVDPYKAEPTKRPKRLSRVSLSAISDNSYSMAKSPTNKEILGKVYHVSTPEFINIIPNGFYLEVKRSSINMFSHFVDLSIEHRDIYLEMMTNFRSIAIKNMSAKYENDVNNKKHVFNPHLPRSFKPLSVFNFHEHVVNGEISQKSLVGYEQHKILFDKFAKMRKDEQIKFKEDDTINVKEYMIDREHFMSQILPFFTERILPLIPIFNMNILKKEFITLYDYMSTHDTISIKNFDHIIVSIIFLITVLTKLSISTSKHPHAKPEYESILQIDTAKYLAIIRHYLFQMKSLRKCTLLQLQCLILLKFYQWCSPEDGDGSDGQHNQILLGTIIASAKELGINWHCINNETFCFKISDGARPNLTNMDSTDYFQIYQNIWSMIISWDRKMFLAFGQECLVSKSSMYPMKNNINNSYGGGCDVDINLHPNTWHMKMLSIDNILLRINDLIHDTPTRVNVSTLEDLVTQIKNELELLKSLPTKFNSGFTSSLPDVNLEVDEKNDSPTMKALDTEFEWCINLLELSILHAKMVYYERTMDYIKFHSSLQELWNFLIIISKKCYDYFFPVDGHEHVNGYMRFYCNRIVEIVCNKICVLLPTFILRLNRFPQATYEDRILMLKFLYRISSVYFNEFAFEHYKSFKKMFTAKISYKMLNRPSGKDIWQNTLQFLIYKLTKQEEVLTNIEDRPNIVCTLLKELLPYLDNYSQYVKDGGFDYTNAEDLERIWNEKIIPVSQYDKFFKLNLHEERLAFIKEDKYAHQLNIFASFYDNSSSELVAGTFGDKLLKQKQHDISNRLSIEAITTDDNSKTNMEQQKTTLTSNQLPFEMNNMTSFAPSQKQFGYPGANTMGSMSSNSTPVNTGTELDNLTKPIDSFSNLEFLNDIFEPTDFISFFK